MKLLAKLIIAAAAPALAFAAPASAQDSDSFVVNLAGSVDSECVLLPDGPVNFDVDMLDVGNQGLLVLGYSCNSPYTVSIQSLNGGMLNTTSGGAVNIPYALEVISTHDGPESFNSGDITSPVVVVEDTDWANIAANGGLAAGNLDLNFAGLLDEYAVAGDYSDELTFVLEAQL